jgi:hypothetical protein
VHTQQHIVKQTRAAERAKSTKNRHHAQLVLLLLCGLVIGDKHLGLLHGSLELGRELGELGRLLRLLAPHGLELRLETLLGGLLVANCCLSLAEFELEFCADFELVRTFVLDLGWEAAPGEGRWWRRCAIVSGGSSSSSGKENKVTRKKRLCVEL